MCFVDVGRFEEEAELSVAKPKPEPVIVLWKTRLLRTEICVEEIQNLSHKKKSGKTELTLEEAIDKIAEDKEENEGICPKAQVSISSSSSSNSVSKNKSRQKCLPKRTKPVCDVDEMDMDFILSYVKPTELGQSRSLWSAMSSEQW